MNGYFAGKDVLLAGVGADNKAALFVDIHGFAAGHVGRSVS